MNKPWFPRKKYGFGWGFPKTWQGLLVLLGYFALCLAGMNMITYNPALLPLFLLYIVAMTGLLFYICWKTGEKPEGYAPGKIEEKC